LTDEMASAKMTTTTEMAAAAATTKAAASATMCGRSGGRERQDGGQNQTGK
jgi:hypothetical protein